ncbi:MAG TPA: ABC transporter substrate-binding protein, partial [Aquaticitalea sp.]|nr:ABC transporter substrate-binding protein [Aquaticitalea sp.]
MINSLKWFLITACFLFGCNPKVDNKSDVFRYNEHKNIGSLDPAFSKDLADIWATNQLFNGLVQMDEQMTVQPAIAKHWTISDDALTYSFTLRNDVWFHKHQLFGNDSTRTVTASDFEYSLNRLSDKQVASPGSWVLSKVDHFKTVNDTVFEITLKQPFPAFLGLLTMKYCSVVPKEIVAHYGSDFRSNPIGTGPFQLKRWEENLKLVFRRNPDYFERDEKNGPLPYLEAI